MLDMHFHSLVSDGKQKPSEVALKGKEIGLEYMFLTDHDRISSSPFRDELNTFGIKSVPSVEISAQNPDHIVRNRPKSLHLTFYTQQVSSHTTAILENTLEKRVKMMRGQLQLLIDKGFEIDLDEFFEYSRTHLKRREDTINKMDITRFIFKNPNNINLISKILGTNDFTSMDFFKRFLKREGDKHLEYGFEVDEYEPTLTQIKEKILIPGKSILSIAHPNFTFSSGIEEFRRVLPNYVEGGVNAIEINAKATKDWVKAIIEEQKKYGLYLTFGSDCHNIGSPDNKHSELGEINEVVGIEFAMREFKKYSGKILGLE